jgi:hypothetical protein
MRQHYDEANRFRQSNADAMRELAYAIGAVIGAGALGAALAYVIWGFK